MQQQKEVVDTITKACAFGDFDALQRFVEADSTSVNATDSQGYFPLQWAALNNRIAEVNFLLSKGSAINQQDSTGQTALHWAAVRGSLPVIETLLRNDANIDIKDNRGYTACHVAAQYGQTAALYHLALKWGVDIDAPDNDGRTPIHWAAYKGFADTIRLLLVLDARYSAPDKEGCTPLHWAAIKGNGEACTVLLQGGSINVLNQKDVTGMTPAQLAVEKGHRYLGLHLSEYKKKNDQGGMFGKNGSLSWLTSTQLAPAIWLYAAITLFVFVYKVMGNMRDGSMGPALTFWSWNVIIAVPAGLCFLYLTTTTDPGFIPTGHDTYGEKRLKDVIHEDGDKSVTESNQRLLGGGRYKSLDSPALWAGHWHQLCVSCRIVRPLRAKHDSVTDRCIEKFDHFCPWVGNAIGKGNQHYFILHVCCEMYASIISAVVCAIQIHWHLTTTNGFISGTFIWLAIFEGVVIFVGLGISTMAIAQLSQVFRNITTNEMANWHRYKYLQAKDGSFFNPFNKGVVNNFKETCIPSSAPMAPVYLPPNTHIGHGGGSPCCGGASHHHHSSSNRNHDDD